MMIWQAILCYSAEKVEGFCEIEYQERSECVKY
jgi:hypothetical protein